MKVEKRVLLPFHKEGILFYPVFSLHKGILIMSSLITIVSQSQRYVIIWREPACGFAGVTRGFTIGAASGVDLVIKGAISLFI